MRCVTMTLTLLTLAWFGQSATAAEPEQPTWALEGVLKKHPKFLYHYYLVIGPNQICALYGPDQQQKPDILADLKEGSRIRVRGTLGTYHHPGSTAKNLSPFPAAWVMYMQVHEARPVEDQR